MSQNCSSCGHENRARAAFCEECGAALARVCARCGTELRPAAKFCDGCGAPVAEAAGAAARERQPRDYTPRHLAEKILQSKSALEGERKQVTVLFADVKGSMELAEAVDPEEWHRILNRFFEILTDGVHRFEGTVNQYTGDGIMALFGAPIAHEDHAQRACYAALHLQGELRSYADELRRTRGLNFSARMGLHSGDVVVGKIGDDLRMDYTAQGYTVGLAARMQEVAEPRSIYLTAATAALVSGYFELRDLGEFELKGVREPVRVHELQRAGAVRTRLDLAKARGLTRFVGRDREMRTLEAALEQAFEGQGQVVGVVGEAGVGKSRLCYEFVEGCRARGVAVYEAHCPSYGKAVPFLPVLELLRNAFGIGEGDDDREARRKIAGTLVLLEDGFRDVLPLVFDFLGVPDPERPAAPMEPGSRQRQLFAFVRRLVQARSAREPAVNLVDDVHWIDAGSDAFLAQLVEVVPRTRTLLLVNFRPEYSASWTESSHYQQIALQPLGPAAAEELVGELLGADPSLRPLPALIRERTGGNPFFVEEVVQSLVEAGALEGTAGAYRLVQPVDELAIPRTVQSVLAARVDRLPEREKQVLRAAAVIGKQVPEPVLRRVAELPDLDLRGALATLTRAEFLYEAALFPEAEYAFKHPLTQEVAYTSQLAERRARLHASVATALTELHRTGPDEHAALVAHHWERSGNALEAARWHRRAAEWVGRSDLGEALRHWSAVCDLLAGEAESPETRSLDVSGRIQVLNLYWRLGASRVEAARVFEQGKEIASRAGDLESLAMLTGAYGAVRGLAGDLAAYCSLCEEAVRLADRTGNRAVRVAMRWRLGYALEETGRLRDFLALVEEGIALCDGDPTLGAEIILASPLVGFLWYRAMAHSLTGHLEEARRDTEVGVRLAREIGESEWLMYLLGRFVYLEELAGTPRRGLDHARQILELGEKAGSALGRIFAQGSLSGALLLREDFGEAASAASTALDIIRESRTGLESQPSHLANLALARLGLGEIAAAREAAEEAVAIARRIGASISEIWARVALARTLIAQRDEGAAAEAERSLARAAALVQETGAITFEPFIRVERAELARLRGDHTAWERELREAHRLFTEIGATGHAERLARELGP